MSLSKSNLQTTTESDEPLPKRARSADSDDYADLAVTRKLSKGRFSLYLTSSKAHQNQNYVMKVFHYAGEKPLDAYNHETRFVFLKHPNIIDMVYNEDEKASVHYGKVKKVSFILMEYAPYGDFVHFLNDHHDRIDERLTRTYFRQLIDGVEYLHTNGVAHLDLKPENMLIGADFNLKIADFDLSYIAGDDKILSKGTRFYRGPEFFLAPDSVSEYVELEDPFAADIYSAGVMLFILKSGTYPHSENHTANGVCMAELMYENNMRFWQKHCEMQERDESFFSPDFKELFNHMIKADPKERLSIKQIKESRWYKGPVYNFIELQEKMKELLS